MKNNGKLWQQTGLNGDKLFARKQNLMKMKVNEGNWTLVLYKNFRVSLNNQHVYDFVQAASYYACVGKQMYRKGN